MEKDMYLDMWENIWEKKIVPTEIRTQVPGFKDQSDNRYTMGTKDTAKDLNLHNRFRSPGLYH